MFNVTHIEDYKTALQEWFYQVHQEMYSEGRSWNRYKEDTTKMERLIDKIESGDFTNEDHDELYAAINEFQLNAADIAYLIGLKHGISLNRVLVDGKITDLL